MYIVVEPKSERGKATLEKLRKAAEVVFAKKGYAGTRIQDITKEAGVAVGSFYVYFRNKQGIFRYILDSISHNIRKESAIAIQGLEKRYDIEKAGAAAYMRYAVRNPSLFTILTESLYADPEFYQKYYDTFSSRYVARMKKAQEKGELKDVNLEVAAYFIMGFLSYWSSKRALFDKAKEITEQEIDDMMKIMSYALFK